MFLQRGVLQPRKEAAINFGCPPVYHSIDDEAIKNVCDINEWMFLEDGTLFSA